MKNAFLVLSLLVSLCLSTPFNARAEENVEQKKAGQTDILFDIDFPGGTPSELISAIEKASGKKPN